jgi:hypothetical protein
MCVHAGAHVHTCIHTHTHTHTHTRIGKDRCFTILSASGKVVFEAPSQEVRNAWIVAGSDAIKDPRKINPQKTCSKCGMLLYRSAFSGQQWDRAPAATRQCTACVEDEMLSAHGAHNESSGPASIGARILGGSVHNGLTEVQGRELVRQYVEEAVGDLCSMLTIVDPKEAREAGGHGLKAVKSALDKMDILVHAPPRVPRITKPATNAIDDGADSDVEIVEEKCDAPPGVRITLRHSTRASRPGSLGHVHGKKGPHGAAKKKAEPDDKDDAKVIAEKCKRLQTTARARWVLKLRTDSAVSAKDHALAATLLRARRYGGPY